MKRYNTVSELLADLNFPPSASEAEEAATFRKLEQQVRAKTTMGLSVDQAHDIIRQQNAHDQAEAAAVKP